jgi:hypothetical protein
MNVSIAPTLFILMTCMVMVSCKNAEPKGESGAVPPEMLAGRWADLSKDSYYIEEWESVGEDHLRGIGYVLANQHTFYIEKLEISPKNGVLTYSVRISGSNNGETVDFQLVSNADNKITFENPAVHFPSRITYEMQTRSTMYLWLEGVENGVPRKTRFIFERQ